MVFVIKPLHADLTGDHDVIGKSDPYCVILIGDQKFQSQPHKGAGKYPKWTQTFTYNGFANELKVQVYDKDLGKDDFYGQGILNLNKWTTNPGKQQTDVVSIELKNKKAGLVTLTIEYQAIANHLGWGTTTTNEAKSSSSSSSGQPNKLGY